jgi:NTE family protein
MARRRMRAALRHPSDESVRIGLALGGGFARGIAHAGILKVFERERIPIDYIAGVSAGSIVAAAFASGATADEIAAAGSVMRFGDVARFSLGRLGLVGSERMPGFLSKLLKKFRFEEMNVPLGIVATDLRTGAPVYFQDEGDVTEAIRASCSYPGLFHPVAAKGRVLVDGAMCTEVPAEMVRAMGATHVISVSLPGPSEAFEAHNIFDVVRRSFQIIMARNEEGWRRFSDLVIAPDVGAVGWRGFTDAKRMLEAGEAAAEKALPEIRKWLAGRRAPAPPVIAPPLASVA